MRLALVLPLLGFAAAAQQRYDPEADRRAVIEAGKARFTVLTPQLIRMEWAADGVFEDRASLVFLNRHLAPPQFSRQNRDGALEIKTEKLTVRYRPDTGKFSAENLSIGLSAGGKAIEWKPGMDAGANLLGTTRTLDGVRGSDAKLEPGLISRDGWALVDDSARPLFDSSDFRYTPSDPWPWVASRRAGDRQDWYFFGYGHDYKLALRDYTAVAGAIPLPPRFAFGAWWSRYWAYTDQELEQLVRDFRSHGVPLDVLVIDMDWHDTRDLAYTRGERDQSGERKGWTGYTWNGLLFPDPAAFLKWVHEQGLKVTMNLHPAGGVEPWEKPYPDMARAMGIDPATEKYVPFEITDRKFALNYLNILHHPLEQQGVNFWWLDWQQKPTTPIDGLNPTWWLNYVHFTDQAREGKRPLIFHRWGGLGNHRYEVGFSGDVISSWESLAFQPYFTATAANVGYAYWSHDIGGHIPGTVEPEMYARWIQFGAFSPILRTHTTRNPDAERRIWAYPEPYSSVMREAFLLRYRLQPYLYTEARRTNESGLAFLRPLYYDYPEAAAAYESKNEYQFGDNVIVAPVAGPTNKETGLASASVWLPPGEWIEWFTGRRFTGPRQIERKFSLPQIPVYVKAGTVLPMQSPVEYTGQKPLDPLLVTVFPLAEKQSTEYRLYEDSGEGLGYLEGQSARTTIRAERAGAGTTVIIAPAEGSYPGMVARRGYEVRLPGSWPPEAVKVNGAAASWTFEGNTLTTVVRVPAQSTAKAVRIEVRVSPVAAGREALLDGFAGRIQRLGEAYGALNALTRQHVWSPDPLIDAWQTGDRLTYHPQTTPAELERFAEALQKAVAAVEQLRADHPDAPIAPVLQLLNDLR